MGACPDFGLMGCGSHEHSDAWAQPRGRHHAGTWRFLGAEGPLLLAWTGRIMKPNTSEWGTVRNGRSGEENQAQSPDTWPWPDTYQHVLGVNDMGLRAHLSDNVFLPGHDCSHGARHRASSPSRPHPHAHVQGITQPPAASGLPPGWGCWVPGPSRGALCG